MLFLGIIFLSSNYNHIGNTGANQINDSGDNRPNCRHSLVERQQFSSKSESEFQNLKSCVCSEGKRIMPGLGVLAGTRCNSCGTRF
jgi:hypothetical protein